MSRTGEGEEVELSRLGDMPEPMPFADWSLDMFRHVCILSGCDYLDSLEGIGLKTAYLLYKRCGKDLEKVCSFSYICLSYLSYLSICLSIYLPKCLCVCDT